MAGIYIHIPFCKKACHYCDFHFSTNQEIKSEFIQALIKEIDLQKNYLGEEVVETIYFGGGTPSVLSAEEIQRILESIRNKFNIHTAPEITLEANPDDLTREKLNQIGNSGINRLSIGIQTFNDKLLTFLNRVHTANHAIRAYTLSRELGFTNINLDLIHSIPGEDIRILESDLEQLIALDPEHISCYSLTIEEKTVFGKWFASGKINAVNEEISAEQFELVMTKLVDAGYEHYEISNFSKPGFNSLHNSAYWKQKKYLGLGPSAHSFNGLTRQSNISNNHFYIKSINNNEPFYQSENLSPSDRINEYILTTLRTMWGTDISYLNNDLNYDLLKSRASYIDNLLKDNLAEIIDSKLILSNKGKLLADKIASDLFT